MIEQDPITKKRNRTRLQVILITGFLAAIAAALVVYINSTFLETLMPKAWVGFFFAISSLITFFVMENYGEIIQRFKNHRVLLFAFFMTAISSVVIAVNPSPVVSLVAFITLLLFHNITVINYDILLENVTTPEMTGRIRGMFWTTISLAYVVSPIIAGELISRFSISAPYIASAFLFVPAFLLILFTYFGEPHAEYSKHVALKHTIKRVIANKNLRGIFAMAFLLYFFYSWMVIYTPLYLLDLGFSWEQIGQMFTVMLIPFVLIEYPAGWLADKFFGETEMLTLGFLIMGFSVFALLGVSSFWMVMIVLFCSRVGASLVEIMRDTYFYKQVDEEDLDLIDTFRNTRSIAWVISPLIASALLWLGLPLHTVFVILGIIMLASVLLPFTVEDTK